MNLGRGLWGLLAMRPVRVGENLAFLMNKRQAHEVNRFIGAPGSREDKS